MTATIHELLADRGLDIEQASARGLNAHRDAASGEVLQIDFVRDGEVVRRKFRHLRKTEDGERRYWQDKGGVRCAWNEDAVKDDTLLAMPLIITEGELDAMSAIQCGFLRSISVPDGAPPPGDRSADDLASSTKYDWLDAIKVYTTPERCPEIIIASDGDENGGALLQDLSILLGRFRCKFLTYPLAKNPARRGRERLKDLNEVLEDYGPEGVSKTINRAQWLKIEGVHRMSEMPELPPQVIYEPRHELLRNHYKVRLGDLSVWTGVPGMGKTTVLNDVLNGISVDHNLTIAWASFEQEIQRDHRRSLRTWFCETPAFKADPHAIAEADVWIDRNHVFIVPNEDEDATLEWLLDRMEVSVARYGAKIIVIDPWNELEHDRAPGESETEYIGRAIRKLKRFAKAFRVHICVVAHPTKSTKDEKGNYKVPTLYDISGSANWYNKADLGVIVHRPDADNTLVKVQKSRYHEVIGKPGEVYMQFSAHDRRFRETERPLTA